MKVLKNSLQQRFWQLSVHRPWQAVEVRQLLMEVRIRRRQRQSRRKR